MQMRYLFVLLAVIAALAQSFPYIVVSGVVRDADSGEPIVGARVKLRTSRQDVNLREENIVTKFGGGFNITLMSVGSL